MAKVNDQQYAAALQEIPIKSLTRNENPLKKLDRIDKPLTIKQDQQEKQVINTIREVPPEMYTPAHLLIPPQDKLSLFRKHIPKQQEIDALLKNLRKRVLHNLMVNLDTKDLIESYTKSLRYREIYSLRHRRQTSWKCKYAEKDCRRGSKLRSSKWPVIQNSATQRKW